MSLYDKIEEAKTFLASYADASCSLGIILGTGLGGLTDKIKIRKQVDYEEIPNFPVSTVESHAGKLIFGSLNGIPVVALSGRFHYYEGYSAKELTFPVRVLKAIGVKTLIVSNAAGGTREDIEAGDLVLIRDHINLHPDNPLRGPNDERLGPRFPDMLNTYSKELRDQAKAVSGELGIEVKEGVYVGLQGPNLETPAEYKYINTIGGDLVGMSTVPEVIVARHSGMEVLALSVVSNKCFPLESITETTIEEVLEVVGKASEKTALLVENLVTRI